jgi:glycosyltransferase involved in cell wall biosynthesis
MNETTFAIVVPMYNEAPNVLKCVESIQDFLKNVNHKSTLIVVDDGSVDATPSVLEELSKRFQRLIIEKHPYNMGYGCANITGAKVACKNGYEYVLFMDADLTQGTTYIYDFIKEMEKGTDFIKATRYSKGGGVNGVPFKRKMVSRLGNLLARFCLRLPLTDYTNGFRAVKSSLLSRITCEQRGFAYLIEEVYRISKLAKIYAEVPYILKVRDKKFAVSKFRYSPRVYYNYLKYLFKK